ncbi:ScbA/BarX family gamma-butyrolactone biosynthesis protein [Streptomyces sp. NPDC007088]|uniref:ScbA/BarX family gamma-butyrolactone biosynthesis protein n=1 Tax=Streptomyces sp. NPDC007088 TaxID=3364773 RepID=UPI0036D0B8DF
MCPLSWSRTVPREWVHRSSAAEVLITDVVARTGNRYAAAAAWSRSHPTFPLDGSDLHHPLLIMETLRQLGIYIPLRHFGVPEDSRLVIADVHFRADPAAEPRAAAACTEVSCDVLATHLRFRNDGTLSGLRLDVTLSAAAGPFARGGGLVHFLPAARYVRMRRGGADLPPPPPEPGLRRPPRRLLGVAHDRDVVIAADGGSARVAPFDVRHPFFFDHPSDHVPGVVLLEAARQAAAYASGGTLVRPRAVRMKAARFTEFRPQAGVHIAIHHRTCAFRIVQGENLTTFGAFEYE